MRKRPEPLTREKRASAGYFGGGLYVNFDFRLSAVALTDGWGDGEGCGEGDSVVAAAQWPIAPGLVCVNNEWRALEVQTTLAAVAPCPRADVTTPTTSPFASTTGVPAASRKIGAEISKRSPPWSDRRAEIVPVVSGSSRRDNGLPITATGVPFSGSEILLSGRKGTPVFVSALSRARSSAGDAARTPVTLRILPSADFVTAWAPPSTICEFVTNRPSSEMKKPVPVLNSCPDASKIVTKITAGPTLLATF